MKSANELLLRAYVTERNDTCQTWQEFRKKLSNLNWKMKTTFARKIKFRTSMHSAKSELLQYINCY